MDAAGVGKIITVSQALFEGITSRTTEECLNISASGPWPGGCRCDTDEDCIIGECMVRWHGDTVALWHGDTVARPWYS